MAQRVGRTEDSRHVQPFRTVHSEVLFEQMNTSIVVFISVNAHVA